MIKIREIARILNRFGFGICTAKERKMLDVRNPLDFRHFIQFHISRSDPDSFLLKLPRKRNFMAVQGEYGKIIDVVRRESCSVTV